MRYHVTLVLVLAACLTGCEVPESNDAPDLRKANILEFAYSYLAPELPMPGLCEKISPRAVLKAGFGGRGYEITYTRSSCYNHLALKTGDANHCRKVVEATHARLDGSALNEEACRGRVAAGRQLTSSGGDIEWLFRFMGFNDSDIPQGRTLIDAYFELARSGLLRDRAAKLPDFSGPPDTPVASGYSASDLGCDDTASRETTWHCYAHRCLASADEGYREACLEIAAFLQVRQRESEEGRMHSLSKRQEDLLERYPNLKTW